MLEKIMNLVKGQVSQAVENNPEIPQEKKQEAVDTTTSTLMDSLKSYATPENISRLTSLLGGGKSEHEAVEQSGIAGGVKSDLISNLTSKVGLSSGAASGLAASIVPMIISMLTNKAKDGSEPGFNIGSLLGAFTGNNNSSPQGSGIMDMIGSFLGKK